MLAGRLEPADYLARLVRARTGMRVRAGPFQGMRYIDRSVGSAFLPKLLGIYERELNDCIEEACGLNFPLIVDIGAAEGYYAVGMALRNPSARVVAFESDPEGRDALRALAKLNDADLRIEIRGSCEPPDLGTVLFNADRCLLICDTEGHEKVLLKPEVIPALARAHLLVELHEFVHRGITEQMQERFRSTHHVRHIRQELRSRHDFPYRTPGTFLGPVEALEWAVSERRPERMAWLWMRPEIQ